MATVKVKLCRDGRPAESEIQKQCLVLLHGIGIFCWRQNSGAMAGSHNGKKRFVRFVVGVKGVSDILGCLPDGRFFACEVKRPGKKPSVEQLDFLSKVNARGGVGIWTDSVEGLEAQLVARGAIPTWTLNK